MAKSLQGKKLASILRVPSAWRVRTHGSDAYGGYLDVPFPAVSLAADERGLPGFETPHWLLGSEKQGTEGEEAQI